MNYVFIVALLVLLGGCMTSVTFPVSATVGVTPTSSSQEDCKSGGWQSLKRSDGSSFRNQGDCVSYFASGK
jgi:hypothetical protein